MSFQRITTIGSIPSSNSEAIASRHDPVAVVLEPVDLDRVVLMSLKSRSRGHRLGDLAASPASSTWASALGLLHRRLDPVQAEVVGDLLDEVDDVVERGASRRMSSRSIGVTNVWLRRSDDVVRDPVALLLADEDVAREFWLSG